MLVEADELPDAVCGISADGVVKWGNRRFLRSVSSVAVGLDFVQNLVGKEDADRFQIALGRLEKREAESDDGSWLSTPIVRNCETLTSTARTDYPVWRRYDWSVSKAQNGDVVLAGRPVSDVGVEKIASEKELVDFLNKAPIAMHWLSGTGHVLWANETEMNVLGYTPEEYIGQPIMKFCPDEEELVLEIFKTLGSGKTIKDVPVRFRTKDNQIKHLLIDSNVNWNADGSFKHTRCFIRDDTARKVREARLQERVRQEAAVAEAKGRFLRKVFHEIRTPCHLLAGAVAAYDGPRDAFTDIASQVHRLRHMVDDVADAALFEEGKGPALVRARTRAHTCTSTRALSHKHSRTHARTRYKAVAGTCAHGRARTHARTHRPLTCAC